MKTPSIRSIVAEVLQVDPSEIKEDSGMNETTNWDSLNQFMIITALERELGARIVFDDIEAISTVQAIREFLRAQGILADD